jgi:hypothetical protein
LNQPENRAQGRPKDCLQITYTCPEFKEDWQHVGWLNKTRTTAELYIQAREALEAEMDTDDIVIFW